MLDTCPGIILDIFLDLALTKPLCRLVDRHLDVLIIVSHNDRPEGTVFSVHDTVIHRPETVEVQCLLVEVRRRHHFQVRLVADHVVDELEVGGLDEFVEGLLQRVGDVSRKEQALEINSLDKGMPGVPILFIFKGKLLEKQ